jgi:hypothetical protein
VKLTKELCEAVLGLRENRAWKIVLEALKEDESIELNRSLQLEGAPCHRAQGSVLKLRELFKFIDDAPANFETLSKQPNKP